MRHSSRPQRHAQRQARGSCRWRCGLRSRREGTTEAQRAQRAQKSELESIGGWRLEVAAVQILNPETCDLRPAMRFSSFLVPLVLLVLPSPSRPFKKLEKRTKRR